MAVTLTHWSAESWPGETVPRPHLPPPTMAPAPTPIYEALVHEWTRAGRTLPDPHRTRAPRQYVTATRYGGEPYGTAEPSYGAAHPPAAADTSATEPPAAVPAPADPAPAPAAPSGGAGGGPAAPSAPTTRSGPAWERVGPL